jgi:hypothetical protein
MASGQSWMSMESLAQTNAGYDLRPLSTGEILDRTFQLYRSRFALFAGLAALPAAVTFISGALQVLTLQGDRVVGKQHITMDIHPIATIVTSMIAAAAYVVLYGITQAATTWAVAEIYLGKPAELRSAWSAAMAHWFRYVRVTLRQYWSIFWLPATLLGTGGLLLLILRKFDTSGWFVVAGLLFGLGGLAMIYAIYAAIRVSLAVPASVIESLNANPAVRRSVDLLVQRKGRIFLLGLLIIAMSFMIGMVLSPLQFIGITARGTEHYVLQMLHLTGTFLSSMAIGPVGAIALCLFYFDERVRHEGFDVEFLMLRAGGPPPDPAVEGTTSPQPA